MAITFNNSRQVSLNIGSVPQSAGVYYVLASGPTYTARSITVAADIFTDTAVVGDYFLVGILSGHSKPAGLVFDVATAIVAAAVTVVWEYRKTDGTWAAFSGVTDNTNNFTTVGVNSITWTMPTDWGTNATAINAITGRMWLRGRLSVATTLTEGGRTGSTPLSMYDYAITVDGSADYTSGTATSGTTTTITDSGKAWTTNELMGRGVWIHTGTNAGLYRRIISNTATTITILDIYPVAIDSTSQYVVGLNFEDIYQANVSGGWGVVTKSGAHSYGFSCNLRFGLAAFMDFEANVEFVQDFYFYCSDAHSIRYPFMLGWRLPPLYGVEKSAFGCIIMSNRTCPMDNRGYGFTQDDEFVFTAGNKFVLRHDYPLTGEGFLRAWFSNRQKYSIDDLWEGWRSVIYPKTSTPRTEVRNPTVIFGHSGIETPNASMSGVRSIYNGSLGVFLTGSSNYTLTEYELTPNNQSGSLSYGSPMQYFGATGVHNIDDYKGNRFRPMIDVFGSTGNTFTTYLRNSVRALVTDEFGNALSGVKFSISDSLSLNRKTFLDFDGGDSITAPNSAVGNQFFGSTAYSVEAWIKQDGVGGSSYGRILDKITGANGFLLGSLSNSLRFAVFTGGTQYISNTVTQTGQAWHHVVGVWDGSTVKLYYDNTTGTATATVGSPGDDSSRELYIGQRFAMDSGWDGQIRRVRIFKNKALSAGDVDTLWNNGDYIQNQSSPVTGCTAEYNFTEGTGTTLTDTSSNAVTATLGTTTSTPTWRDTNAGLSSNSITANTGVMDAFLSATDVATGSYYSLTTQPTAPTTLRLVVQDFRDTGATAGLNANVSISGTDADGNAISDIIYIENIQVGTYFTKKEFLTVGASGIYVVGFSGSISVDNLGILSPQKVVTEVWRTPDDVNLLTTDYNPIVIKVSKPGFEPITIKKNIYERQDLVISLKKSRLNLTSGT